MALNSLAIVEFGAQKQRISLDANGSYADICGQIYSLFKLDFSKSKYILQRQDNITPGAFTNVDERTLLNDLRQYATYKIKAPVIRLRLVPGSSVNSSKATNGCVNGEKTWSTSSQGQPDESDRASSISATPINIKQLIKKCLTNLKETTENIQLLDRCLHPEDYIDEEIPPTAKPPSNQPQLSVPINNHTSSQISQISSNSDSRRTPSVNVDELVPALNHLLNTQLPTALLSTNKPIPSPPVPPQITVNSQTPAPISNTNVPPSRPPNKSFSNRLGMTMTPNPTHTIAPQESKPISTPHQYLPRESKSPVVSKPSAAPPLKRYQPETRPSEITPTSAPVSKHRIEMKQFEPSASIEGIVSVASNASYFFLQLIDQHKEEFDQLSKSLHEHYSNLGKNSHYHPAPGDFCAAMYTEDARWYRARVIRYLSDQTCEVFYIDYGNMEELPIDFVHELLPDFARLPARAIACTIAQILPPNGQEGWTKRATFAFASRCSNERVQATVVDSTNMKWPMHIVRLRVSKTQEDIGSSLEDCKVARHVSNNEICEFWSTKIRLEQYILYNLQEANPNRFPVVEQVPTKQEKEEESNTFLSSSLQQSPSSASSTTENTNAPKEIINQIVSDIVIEEERSKLEQHRQSTPDFPEEKPIEQDEITPSTPSSALNPEASPFVALSTTKIASNQSISTGEESDDEDDSGATPVSSDSFERPRMPIKEEVIVDTSLMPSTPLLKSWLPIEVTHIETPTRFYIRYIYGPSWNLGNGQTPDLIDKKELPEKNVLLKELTHEMTQCYSKQKRICPGDSYDGGELVAVKSHCQWHRGRFLQYKANIDFAHIFFVDYGNTRALPIQMIRPINNRFVLHAEQAHLVHLHQPGQRRGRIEWNIDVIDEFREMSKSGTHLYARITNEPNTVDLMSYDPLTKKWFSFYEHFVKHVNNSDEIEPKTD